ncbi:MAG: SRPBCC family protein [Chloroflexi bacterium]|nr:SRPBCC family protein [Chloroflexota bacterium]
MVRTTIKATIYIDRPPEAVTAALLEPAKMPLWTSDLDHFEVISGQPGHVGAKGLAHYVQDGRPYVMEDLLLVAEPNRRYVSRISMEALTAEIETTLEPSGPGTQVTIRWSGVGRPPLLRLLLPFMRRSIARQAQGDLQKLKALVEGGLD